MFEFMRSLTPQQLLVVNGLIVTLLAVYFFTGRRRRPTALTMNSGTAESPQQTPSSLPDVPKEVPPGKPKSLNVIFMYNQHSFDAYEILGVPAGSSYAVIREAYDDMVRQIPGERRPLVEAAYRAILADR